MILGCFMKNKKNYFKRIISNISKEDLKKLYIEMIEIWIIAIIILAVWQGIELLLYNEIRPNMFHTLIAIAIVNYLHFLYKKYIKSIFINKNKKDYKS